MSVPVTPAEEETKTHPLPLWKRFPSYGYLALGLNMAAWFGSWSTGQTLLQSLSFFPLWFSFILVLDALNKARTGTSLLTRAPAKFVQMFLFSSLIWWLFELLNWPVHAWQYVSAFSYPVGSVFAVSLASLNFTIVLPVVMEMAELLCTVKVLRPRLPASAVGERASSLTIASLMLLGLLFLVIPYLWPNIGFFLMWLSVGLLLDPLNNLLGRRSALAHLKARDWRFFVTLPLAALLCGFFWEMWNYYSLPKWQYNIPFVGFGKVFEMPILGYTGYLPFAVELFALYQFLLAATDQHQDHLSF
jgi:hypothetical protein